MPARIENLDLPGPAGRLEALLTHLDGLPKAASVIAHPHPLHGGTMHSRVVFRAAKALERQGIATLRFNFRGVGRSEGVHDSGRGEREDLLAAIDAVAARYDGLPLLLGGYSFGAVVALGVEDPRVVSRFAIGFPLSFAALPETLVESRVPTLFIQGEKDAFGSGELLKAKLETLPVRHALSVVPGADHSFEGKLDLLESALEAWVGKAGM